MSVRAWRPAIALRLERGVRLASVVMLVTLVAIAVVMEWEVLARYAGVVGAAAVGFNLISLFSGYGAARALRLGVPQATAIAFEIGIHNGTLAIYVALQVLSMAAASVVPAIYALSMYATGLLFALWLLRRAAR
jgi:BASS family bile acid:Na+ symporter